MKLGIPETQLELDACAKCTGAYRGGKRIKGIRLRGSNWCRRCWQVWWLTIATLSSVRQAEKRLRRRNGDRI
jgi:hypothetical protein